MEANPETGAGSDSAAEACVVLSTYGSYEDAVRVSRLLVERRLIACANIVQGVRSIFRWEGKIEEEGEVLVVMKTRRARLSELTAELGTLHPYEVPELLALPVIGGGADYLGWVVRETREAG